MTTKTKTKIVEAKLTTDTTGLDKKEVTKEVSVYQKQVDAITISDQSSYAEVAGILKNVKAWIKEKTDKYFTPKYNAIKALKATIDADYNELIAPAERLESSLKGKMSAWEVSERRRLFEEAQKEKATLEKKADKAEAKGKDDKAEELREQAASITAPTKVVNTSGLGTSSRVDYEVTVTELKSFLTFAFKDKDVDLSALVEIKKGELKKMGKRYYESKLKEDGAKIEDAERSIPGATIKEKAVISA